MVHFFHVLLWFAKQNCDGMMISEKMHLFTLQILSNMTIIDAKRYDTSLIVQ